MTKADAEEYTQALGQVVAGGWRQIALGDRLGVPKALGLTTQAWVQQRLGGYVKLSVEERKQAVKELKAEGISERKITGVLGVDRTTVRADQGKPSGRNPTTKGAKTKGNSSRAVGILPPDTPIDALAGLAATTEVREAAAKQQERAARQEHRAAVTAARPTPPPPTGRYYLLYADPPWRYEHVKTESRAIENQYPTLPLDAIRQTKAPAADDAILFLWATSPKLAEALSVIEAWGFEYRTCAVWDKEIIGMGYYFRQQHELLLVATKGEPKPPAPDLRVSSVFRSKRGDHSEKPSFIYAYLEAMYPMFGETERVELYGREKRVGWSLWGNEPGE